MSCPKCKADIDHLIMCETGTITYEYSANGFEMDEFQGDGRGESYYCPECDTVVATSQEEADKILGLEVK